jgi:hypothetical protein
VLATTPCKPAELIAPTTSSSDLAELTSTEAPLIAKSPPLNVSISAEYETSVFADAETPV